MTSQLFIVRITRDARRFVAWARRVDEEVCGEFAQPQQLLNFLLDRQRGTAPAHTDAHPSEGARHDEP